MPDHFLWMVIYAAITSVFFALLWRRQPRQQLVLGGKVFLGMVVGGLVLAWLMYFFPGGPPTSAP